MKSVADQLLRQVVLSRREAVDESLEVCIAILRRELVAVNRCIRYLETEIQVRRAVDKGILPGVQ